MPIKNPINIQPSDFEAYFEPEIDRFQRLTISSEGFKRASEWANQAVGEKKDEKVHKIDDDREEVRWLTGTTGETALEEFLGASFRDETFGESRKYGVPDLEPLGIRAGVKCIKRGNFPVVPVNPKWPEVIVVKDDAEFYICGIATPQDMRECSTMGLILNRKLRERGVKTGFYGFDRLIPFNNLAELKMLVERIGKGMLTSRNDLERTYLDDTISILYDYDGCRRPEDLMRLIDEARERLINLRDGKVPV